MITTTSKRLLDYSETLTEIPQKYWLQSVTWSDHKYQNTAEFLVCVVPNTRITLSKVCTRRTSDKAIILQSCF